MAFSVSAFVKILKLVVVNPPQHPQACVLRVDLTRFSEKFRTHIISSR